MGVNTDLHLGTLNHDLTLSRYDFGLVHYADALRQRLKVRLMLFFQSWFLQRQDGVPYYESFLKKSPDIGELSAILKTAILTTKRVKELTFFELAFDNAQRILYLNFTVLSEDGYITLNEALTP